MFKVGDEVWSPEYGIGEVVEIETSEDWPVIVRFERRDDDGDRCSQSYTHDGRRVVWLLPTLFHKGAAKLVVGTPHTETFTRYVPVFSHGLGTHTYSSEHVARANNPGCKAVVTVTYTETVYKLEGED